MTVSRTEHLLRTLVVSMACGLAASSVTPSLAAPPPSGLSAANDASAALSAPLVAGNRTQRFSLRELGALSPLQFHGTDHSIYLPLIVRLDETVVGARLKTNYTFSPSLIPELSQFKVLVNDEALATIAASKQTLGSPQTADLSLDPRFFTEYSKLRLQFIGHYTYDCEYPFHTSLWGNISNESVLELETKPLVLRNDLGLLPAPFFDMRDSRRLVLPFVMPAKPTMGTVRSAAVLASWFGALASYRGAQFPVLQDKLPNRHAVIVATNDDAPAGLNIPKVDVPTIAVMQHPQDASVKLLLVLGKDEAQLKLAADALVLGQAALTGERAQVQSVKYPQARLAYDAPTMAPVGQKVKMGQLVKSPADLQTRGAVLNPIRVDMRLPADVFTWESKGIPMDVRYRYTPPRELGMGGLAVQLNDQLVQSLLLRPAGAPSRGDRVTVPFLDTNQAVSQQDMVVPAFQIAANNRLDFRFDIPPPDEGKCLTRMSGSQASIDADSEIDLRGLEHYTTLPNLNFYADSGFPFTKFADLAQTALLLPDAPQAAEIQAALEAVGHLGANTGVPGTSLTVLPAAQQANAGDRDLLIVAIGDSPAPLSTWGETLPARLQAAQRSNTALSRFVDASSEWFGGAAKRAVPRDGWAQIAATGPLGALLAFESPVTKGRSVVVINGTDAASLPSATEALLDRGKARLIQGDLVLVRGDTVEPFRIGETYNVGHLTWWRWMWLQFHDHPLLLALLAIVMAILIAVLLYAVLRRVAARRLSRAG